MKLSIKIILLLSGLVLLFSQCEKEKEPNIQQNPNLPPPEIKDTCMLELTVDSCVLVPIGQLIEKGNEVDILIDDRLYHFEILEDGLGGSWAILPNEIFPENCTLSVRINRIVNPVQLFPLRNDTTFAYLKSSTYINWKDIDLRLAAASVYDSQKTNTENAIALQELVMDRITFNSTFTNSYGEFTASHTYLDQRGVCINFARVFIALCRAVNIKSRSVSGVIFEPGPVGSDCFHHHEWCEFLDENNNWRSIDLTYTNDIDITNIHYIDFTYCNEETEIFSKHFRKYMGDAGMPFRTSNQVVVIYGYLPFLDTARFGFQLLEDKRPESILFEKKVSVRKSNGIVFIEHL